MTHTRATTPHGPDFCAECSDDLTQWVRWPCPNVAPHEGAIAVRHNHITRDIKPPGECPKCDEHSMSHARRDGYWAGRTDVTYGRISSVPPYLDCDGQDEWVLGYQTGRQSALGDRP